MATSGRPVDEATRQRVERLVRMGRSISEIARQVGCHRQTVRNCVSESAAKPEREDRHERQ